MRPAEGVAATGATVIHMGKGATKYTSTVKTGDIFVSQGTVTARSVLGTAHQAGHAAVRGVWLAVRNNPMLHDPADALLRRSGISSRMYGKI